nr:putative trans-2-enoyl-coa reductase, mitochondrial [Quercus suber]
MAQTVTYEMRNGVPNIIMQSHKEPTPGKNQVLIRWLAAPINPLDVLVLKDVYPVKPIHKHEGRPIPGYDGVAEIIRCGESVTNLTNGDIVIPSMFGIGTWRTHAVLDTNFLIKVNRPDNIAFAAILRTSIAPAFFLVEDIAKVKPGEFIIQNAGTSAIAQMVVQFARRRGVGVISVIRHRTENDANEIKRSLISLGAHTVITETELIEGTNIRGKNITLALDSAFGSSGQALVKALSQGGTYAQLGFLEGSESRITISARDLFGRQLSMRGFRGSGHLAARTVDEQRSLFNWFIELFNKNELILPILGLVKIAWEPEFVSASSESVLMAVKRAQSGVLGQRKQVIVFE